LISGISYSFPSTNWRLIHLLGISNLRIRYSRSKLGQAWLVISLFIQIATTGVVWSLLWHVPLREFLPYVALGQVIYQFFLTNTQDSNYLFVSDSRLYVNQRLPFVTSTFANLYKNTLIFLHNLPIVVLTLIFSNLSWHPSLHLLWIMPCAMIFMFCSSYVISAICTRYRDLQQVVNSLLSISFLVTPIMWKLSYIPERMRPYFFLNPLTGFVEALRNPFIDLPVSAYAYDSMILWTTLSVIVMAYIHRRFEKRIIMWV
jgi:lipopolysaccharide transport system permease protein